MDKKAMEGQEKYQKMVKDLQPKPKTFRNALWAFLIGGIICLTGQAVYVFFKAIEPTEAEAVSATLAGMITLGSIATGLGVYDWLAELGGMGAAVPITGFSNTVAAAAMDFKREGWILGMGSKMFIIAGPIIVYGILSGFVVGLVKSAALGLFK